MPNPKPKIDSISDPAVETQPKSKARMSWIRLLKKVFNIDGESCQICGGKVRVIAVIEDRRVIRKILTHLGFDTKLPPIWPADCSRLNLIRAPQIRDH